MFSDANNSSTEVNANQFRVSFGPSFRKGLPIKEDWLDFVNQTQEPLASTLMSLWFEKAKAENNIPLRKNFSFSELAKLGGNLAICKLTDDNRWLTTFGGNALASLVGLEFTGRHLDEISDDKTLKFWCDNLKIMTEQSKPFFEFYDLDYANKSYTNCEALNLPLKSGNHDFADMFLSYTTGIKNSDHQ